MSAVEDYALAQEAATLRDLVEFAEIPSVSTDPAFAADVRRAAEWVAARLRRAGMEAVALHETGGHPVVMAEWRHAPGAPTVLVYGHYDVQPADPVEKWRTPAFAPTIREDRLYARGVSDDKGPVLTAFAVAEAFIATTGRLPLNVVFLIEGEEEMGSAHLEAFVAAHPAELAADFVLSADGAMWRADLPSMTIASRGICTVEATLHGAAKDLHSGRHGGSAPNALAGMARLVASLHDDTGRVAVAGFYDGVTRPPADALAGIAFDEAAYLAEIGAAGPGGEDGLALLARQWSEPTLEPNGLWGGYTGAGTKTVIPAEAHVKLSCRLVPGQDPRRIQQAIATHLRAHCPPAFRLDVDLPDHVAEPYAIRGDHPGLQVAEDILAEVLGRRPVRVRMGATIPVAEAFQRVLGLDTVFFSFSTTDEDYHAPNEFFRLSSLRTGLRAWVRCWERLGRLDAAGFGRLNRS